MLTQNQQPLPRIPSTGNLPSCAPTPPASPSQLNEHALQHHCKIDENHCKIIAKSLQNHCSCARPSAFPADFSASGSKQLSCLHATQPAASSMPAPSVQWIQGVGGVGAGADDEGHSRFQGKRRFLPEGEFTIADGDCRVDERPI